MLRGKDLAEYLKKARTNAGLSQKEVAAILGYKSSQFVSNWERGLSSPPVSTLRRLCSLYRTNENEMFQIIRDIAVRQLEQDLRQEFFAEVKNASSEPMHGESPQEALK
jgi:transcriptional regulator with XRE-family HTH domain